MSPSTRPSTVGGPRAAIRQDVHATDMTVWVGWIGFASVVMTLLGTLHVAEGLLAVFQQEYFKVGRSGLVVHADYTVWGVGHILGGVLILLSAVGVLLGKVWARAVAVGLALASVLVSIAFLAADPLWSVVVITLDLVVVWALTVHGREIQR
jgi:hypothetical protein